ncbi:MAG: cobalamin-dependent protein [Bifidobacteriaceae bacterium]|jgi:5-methyltetrahydrofolate--homocysteine methyltransferase|nr:cobalamin-dependent protein [Bifidobacteriaceae bacterium]
MDQGTLSRLSALTENGKVNRALGRGQDGVEEVTAQALAEGHSPAAVLEALTAGMAVVGDRFAAGKAFVPNMLLAARAMSAGMALLKPFFDSGEVQRKGVFIIGTVFGDLHDIGKNLVAMAAEGAGWSVVDLGVDIQPEGFTAALDANPGAVVGLSALLTTTMGNMEPVIQAIRRARPDTRVIVGGAPLTREFADKIGADGYSSNPAGAVELLAGFAAEPSGGAL